MKNDINLFYEFYENPQGKCVVAILSSEACTLLQVTVNEILLSDQSLIKNKKHHPDITIDDYCLIQSVIDNADSIILERNYYLLISKLPFYLVIKAIKAKDELYLTSFRRTNKTDQKRVRKKGEIIKDNT